VAAHIDAHLHLACDGEAGLAMLDELDLMLLNISVPVPDRQKWRARTAVFRSLAEQHPQRFAWVAGFDLPTWDADGTLEADYAERVIAGLAEDLDAGAVGVKIWKNVGMEVIKPSGDYLMVDDPLYDPIYEFLARRDTTLLLHIGEPLSCWLPLDDPEDPHYGYYSKNPQWHFHGRDDVPSHQQIMDARDRMVAGNPDLRVVGAHLASLEYDVAEVARRFDEFPNFAVDTSARLLDLARQDVGTVRDFFEAYADRILFGTDIVDDTPWSSLDDDTVAQKR
jgi:predicted TIM-barrel fold metal-dependent hydrolase